MKKIITIAIGGILLASCGTTKTIVVEKPATTTIPEIATLPPVMDGESNFLNGMTSDFPSEVSNLGKVKVLELGRLTCQAIDEGSTVSDFAGLASKVGVDGGFIGALIREAVENFCPENQWFIDSALKGSGI